MELIPINESKLKIMLDEIDMKEYRLCAESDCAELETRRAIRDILDAARDQIGFNTEGAEIFVQLYTSKRGGCELFVTKGSPKERSESNELYKTDRISPVVQPKGNQASQQSKPKKKEGARPTSGALTIRTGGLPDAKDACSLAFYFSRLSDLCRTCKSLQKRKSNLKSSAYYDDKEGFYLLLYDTGMSAYTRLDRFSFIHEYGTSLNPEKALTYLSEHGHVICSDNAVQTLGKL